MELREPGVQNSPMCLLALAWNVHPRWRLLLAGHRDEFHARPTAPLAPWASAPHVLAGRDLQSGGTWAGADRQGRMAVVTNVRDPRIQVPGAPSRGQLAAGFLQSPDGADHRASGLLAAAEAWAREHGFASMRVRSNILRERAHRFYLREGYIEKKRQAVFLKRF